MAAKTPCFSINGYDYEGDEFESGIFLHFDDTRILVAETPKEYRLFIEHLEKMESEISETFG